VPIIAVHLPAQDVHTTVLTQQCASWSRHLL